MKIALTASLLLGFATHVSSFACDWNGAGSSYVYHSLLFSDDEDNSNNNNDLDWPCIDAIINDYHTTTCCRCASAGECNEPQGDNSFVGYGTQQYQPENNGCDLYPPTISIADAVSGASCPGTWFTSTAELDRYLEETVKCTDDCVTQPTCQIQVDYDFDNGDDRCGNTYVLVTSIDRANSDCHNQNYAQEEFYVRYDSEAPTVDVNLGTFKLSK